MDTLHLLPGCLVERVRRDGAGVIVEARAAGASACCPDCRRPSTAVHSTYVRRPQDLPLLGSSVRLELRLRRFYCRNQACQRRTFAERVPRLLEPRARFTRRSASVQAMAAVELGGEAGARLLGRLGIGGSADTLLRELRRMPLPRCEPARVIGVDDWAMRKRHSYGTILIDLVRRSVIDVLPDRTAATLARWLRAHKSIRIVARDRSTEYARGIRSGAPGAAQVADRWHLLINIRAMLERWLTGARARLARLPTPNQGQPRPPREHAFPRSPSEEAASRASAAHWRAKYEEIRRRHAAGEPLLCIARAMGLARVTVRRLAHADSFPERARHPLQPTILEPYLEQLARRHAEGCENGAQLWREICAAGYRGTARQVRRWLQQRRSAPARTQPATSKPTSAARADGYRQRAGELPSAARLAWLTTRPPDTLEPKDLEHLERVRQDKQAARLIALVQDFARLIRDKASPAAHRRKKLTGWLRHAKACGIGAMHTFARGLDGDIKAVRAAITTEWSNAQAEGHITKLKLIKRQMYGRAGFDLLRRRVLLAA